MILSDSRSSGSIASFLTGRNSRSLCCPFDSGANTLIGAATANITGHRRVNIRIAGVRIGRQQRCCRHDLARLAIAALKDFNSEPGVLHLLPLGVSPTASMVVRFFPTALTTGVMQERIAMRKLSSKTLMPVNSPRASSITPSEGHSGFLTHCTTNAANGLH